MGEPRPRSEAQRRASAENFKRARAARHNKLPPPDRPLAHYLDVKLLERAASADLSDSQLAMILHVEKKLIKRLRTRPDWIEIVERGKAHAKQVVESSLFARCTGTEYEEVTRERVLIGRVRQIEKKDKEGPLDPVKGSTAASGHGQERIYGVKAALVVTKTVRKRIEPDTEAIKFYLSNVDSVNWKIRTQQDQTTTRKLEIAELSGKTRDELIAIRDRLRKRIEELRAGRDAAAKN